MLKIDVIHFEALDVITTSIPVAEEQAPVTEEKAPENTNNDVTNNGNTNNGGNNGEGDEGDNGKPTCCDHFSKLSDGTWVHNPDLYDTCYCSMDHS